MVPPGFSCPLASAASIILHRDPVLGTAAWVEVFDLCHHGAGAVGDDGVQANQWGAADEVTDVLRDPHAFIVSGDLARTLRGRR